MERKKGKKRRKKKKKKENMVYGVGIVAKIMCPNIISASKSTNFL